MSLAFGLVYDLHGTYPRRPGDPQDVDAEYEPEATIAVLEAAIVRLGHRPVRIGSPHALLARLGKGSGLGLDVALSVAEGFGGRNREAWAPVLLEMAGVPCLGSDALTLSATLDKDWARTLVEAAGVAVPAGGSVATEDEARSVEIPGGFPLFVKPRWEGTAKGIRTTSRVADREALIREVARIRRDYDQPALVERFVGGAEFTVTIVGSAPPRALPVLQRGVERETRIGVHALPASDAPPGGFAAETPGVLTRALEAELARLGVAAFEALQCRDFARADFRLDERDLPLFLEMNPLPTFAPDGSFGILAELAGRPLDDLLAEIFGAALARLGLA